MDSSRMRDILQEALSQLQQFQQQNSPTSTTPVAQIAPGAQTPLPTPSIGGFPFQDRLVGQIPPTSLAPGATTSLAPTSLGGFNFPDRYGGTISSPSTLALTGQQRHGVFSPNAGFRHSTSTLGLQEFRQLSSPYSQAQNRRNILSRSTMSRATVTREKLLRLFCMGSPTDMYSPNAAYKNELEILGLGEKSVTLDKSNSSDNVKSIIQQAYPMLGSNGFELMRASGGGAGKKLLRINEFQSIPSTSILMDIGGRSLVYVRPSASIIPEEGDDSMEGYASNTSSTGNSSVSSPHSQTSRLLRSCDQTSDVIQQDSCTRPTSETSPIGHNQTFPQIQSNPLPGTSTNPSNPPGGMNVLPRSPTLLFPKEVFATSEDLRAAVHNSNPGEKLIVVQRERLLDKIIDLYTKDSTLDVRVKPKITFLGEEGIDLGGLTKEFFSESQTSVLVERYMTRYPIFEGQEDHKLPSADIMLLHSGVFKALGKFMAHGYINTGVALQGISTAVMQYVLYRTINEDTYFAITKEDVVNVDARVILSKLENWTAETQLEDVQVVRSFLNAHGINTELSLENKSLLIQNLMLHEVIDSRRGQLEDMRKGFWCSGVGDFLADREYLWDGAFPKMMDHRYEPSVLLASIDFVGVGVDFERVKIVVVDYLQSMNSDRLRDFVRAATGWPYLTNNRIKIAVGRYNRFYISTCFDTVEIPQDMSPELIQNCFELAMNSSYFGSS